MSIIFLIFYFRALKNRAAPTNRKNISPTEAARSGGILPLLPRLWPVRINTKNMNDMIIDRPRPTARSGGGWPPTECRSIPV